MLPKSSRLTRGDIVELSKGKSASTALISMRYITAPGLKFSVSVSKKIAPTAVARNTIRRRTYSLLQSMQGSIKSSVHVMLMPKKEFIAQDTATMERELLTLFKRAGLID